MRETVHNCQWFYLERGIDMFDTGAKPILVKEFRPIKDRDCSIKFSKVSALDWQLDHEELGQQHPLVIFITASLLWHFKRLSHRNT